MEDLGTRSDGILSLKQVTKADSGTYRCQVLDFDSPGEVNLERDVTIDVNCECPVEFWERGQRGVPGEEGWESVPGLPLFPLVR